MSICYLYFTVHRSLLETAPAQTTALRMSLASEGICGKEMRSAARQGRGGDKRKMIACLPAQGY